jgi:hypothetical protein
MPSTNIVGKAWVSNRKERGISINVERVGERAEHFAKHEPCRAWFPANGGPFHCVFKFEGRPVERLWPCPRTESCQPQ